MLESKYKKEKIENALLAKEIESKKKGIEKNNEVNVCLVRLSTI